MTDARGSITRHEYDAMDRLSRRIDPLNRVEAFSYDANGNVTSTAGRKSQTTTFTYDALNRRTQVTYADASMTAYTYDAGNRLTQVVDSLTGTITRTHDTRDRLLSETTPQGTVSYTYDAGGRRTQMTVSGQAPVSYTYDHNARLRTITQAPLNPATIDYDAVNRRTALVLPNGVSTEYQYDAASQLTALIYRNALGATLGNLQYTYDGNGNRVAIGGSWARTNLPTAVSSSTYDQANEQFAFGPVAQTFDPKGNLLTQTDASGTTTYTWDARNRLVALTGPGTSASFAYDAFGRRAVKTINGQTTSFGYDGLDAIKENGGAGEVTYLRTATIDQALTRTDSTGTVHYMGDGLGSTLALADGAGDAATAYTYAPFGDTAVSGTPNANPFQFTGRENDGTRLYYYRARYFDPIRGRFVGEDPIGFAGGINLYTYVGNSPVNGIDPTGEIIAPVYGAYVGLTAIAVGFINWWYWATHPTDPPQPEPKIGGMPVQPIPGPAPVPPVPICR